MHECNVAKRRLYDAFLIAMKLGRDRIRDDLVHEALSCADVTVRSKLMFALAAILATDVVGYSCLIGEDETGRALWSRASRDRS